MNQPLRAVAVFLMGFAVFASTNPDDQVGHHRKMLADAGVSTEPAELVHFFHERTLTSAVRERLGRLLRQLGDCDFEVREKATRELIDLGALAYPSLQRALGDPDAEIASRAKLCLDSIKVPRVGPELIAAAARLLAAQNDPRTVEVLLAYLPSAADEALEEEIVAVLLSSGIQGGVVHPALVKAAIDPLPVLRLAAAGPLARAGGEHRTTVRKLLDDPEPRVRLFAAEALIAAGDKAGVPTLIQLLGDGPVHLVWAAEDQLCRLAGDQSPAPALDPANAPSRQKCRAAWEAWWKATEATIDLARLPPPQRGLGLLLICDFDGGPSGQGMVYECDPGGKVRWKIDTVQGPTDAHILPNGRVLIAEHHAGRVTERTREGKIVWEHRVTGNPVACQRLTTGNTFMATYTELLEVTREGKTVYSIQRPYGVYCAQRLANGNILYIHSNNQIVEVDTAGREKATVAAGNTGGWASVELLANGRYLVALYNANKVKEIDSNGKVYFDATVPLATYAARLSNGNTLAADTQNRRLVEFDRLGNEVRRLASTGRPFRVRWR